MNIIPQLEHPRRHAKNWYVNYEAIYLKFKLFKEWKNELLLWFENKLHFQ